MDFWTSVGCVAVIVVGVATIVYVLFHAPKAGAKIGTPSSIEVGDEPAPEEADVPAEEANAPAENEEAAAKEPEKAEDAEK